MIAWIVIWTHFEFERVCVLGIVSKKSVRKMKQYNWSKYRRKTLSNSRCKECQNCENKDKVVKNVAAKFDCTTEMAFGVCVFLFTIFEAANSTIFWICTSFVRTRLRDWFASSVSSPLVNGKRTPSSGLCWIHSSFFYFFVLRIFFFLIF